MPRTVFVYYAPSDQPVVDLLKRELRAFDIIVIPQRPLPSPGSAPESSQPADCVLVIISDLSLKSPHLKATVAQLVNSGRPQLPIIPLFLHDQEFFNAWEMLDPYPPVFLNYHQPNSTIFTLVHRIEANSLTSTRESSVQPIDPPLTDDRQFMPGVSWPGITAHRKRSESISFLPFLSPGLISRLKAQLGSWLPRLGKLLAKIHSGFRRVFAPSSFPDKRRVGIVGAILILVFMGTGLIINLSRSSKSSGIIAAHLMATATAKLTKNGTVFPLKSTPSPQATAIPTGSTQGTVTAKLTPPPATPPGTPTPSTNTTVTPKQTANPTPTPTPETTEYDDTDPSVTYNGTWSLLTDDPAYYQSTRHVSSTPGNSVSFTFFGTSINWVGSYNSNHGFAQVSLDGAVVGIIDTYSPTWKKQQSNFIQTGLAKGQHTITIVVLGEKEQVSSGFVQAVDAFIVQR